MQWLYVDIRCYYISLTYPSTYWLVLCHCLCLFSVPHIGYFSGGIYYIIWWLTFTVLITRHYIKCSYIILDGMFAGSRLFSYIVGRGCSSYLYLVLMLINVYCRVFSLFLRVITLRHGRFGTLVRYDFAVTWWCKLGSSPHGGGSQKQRRMYCSAYINVSYSLCCVRTSTRAPALSALFATSCGSCGLRLCVADTGYIIPACRHAFGGRTMCAALLLRDGFRRVRRWRGRLTSRWRRTFHCGTISADWAALHALPVVPVLTPFISVLFSLTDGLIALVLLWFMTYFCDIIWYCIPSRYLMPLLFILLPLCYITVFSIRD